MSFYLRSIPNKFTSFVNIRRQITDINYRLPKNVKSLFLEEVNSFTYTTIFNHFYLNKNFNYCHLKLFYFSFHIIMKYKLTLIYLCNSLS